MSDEELDEELQRFLLRAVETYDELDTLLAFANGSALEWSAARIEERLQLPASTTKAALDRLAERGIVRARRAGSDDLYALDPAFAGIVARLERVFAANRLVIVRWMNARAIARVRDEAHKTFADAFVLRRKNPDG